MFLFGLAAQNEWGYLRGIMRFFHILANSSFKRLILSYLHTCKLLKMIISSNQFFVFLTKSYFFIHRCSCLGSLDWPEILDFSYCSIIRYTRYLYSAPSNFSNTLWVPANNPGPQYSIFCVLK